MSKEKNLTRLVQRLTGATYSSALRWTRTLHEGDLIVTYDPRDKAAEETAVRDALSKRFPAVRLVGRSGMEVSAVDGGRGE